MAFMGELSDIGVTDLLYLLALGRRSGKLAISAHGDDVVLFMHKGQVALITSSNMALRLGRMLTRLGILTPERLREALSIQEHEESGKPLGTILIERGFISEAELKSCVEEQCVEILARVIGAETGIFIYHRDVEVPAQTELVPLNADRIMLLATSRSDVLVALRSLLPSATAPLVLSSSLDEVAATLSGPERLVASALAPGPASLDEIDSRLGMDEVTLWETIVGMRGRGLIVAGSPSVVEAGSPD